MNKSPSARKSWKNISEFIPGPGSPLKVTTTRDAATLSAQTSGQSACPLEATPANKFKSERAEIVLEFDAAKNQMILKQGGTETVFTREKFGSN